MWKSEVVVAIAEGMSVMIKIETGVRQGDSLSTTLRLNGYSEHWIVKA